MLGVVPVTWAGGREKGRVRPLLPKVDLAELNGEFGSGSL